MLIAFILTWVKVKIIFYHFSDQQNIITYSVTWCCQIGQMFCKETERTSDARRQHREIVTDLLYVDIPQNLGLVCLRTYLIELSIANCLSVDLFLLENNMHFINCLLYEPASCDVLFISFNVLFITSLPHATVFLDFMAYSKL